MSSRGAHREQRGQLTLRGLVLLELMLLACVSALFGAPIGVLAFAAALLCISLYELSQERALMTALAQVELRWGASLRVKDPSLLSSVYEQEVGSDESGRLNGLVRRSPCRRGESQTIALTLQNPGATGILFITPLSSEGAHERFQLCLEVGAEVTLMIPFRLERAGTLKLWGLEPMSCQILLCCGNLRRLLFL